MKFETDIERFNLPEAYNDIEYFKSFFPYNEAIFEILSKEKSTKLLSEKLTSFYGGNGFSREPCYYYRFGPKGLVIRYTLFHEIERDFFGGVDLVDSANFYISLSKSEVIQLWNYSITVSNS